MLFGNCRRCAAKARFSIVGCLATIFLWQLALCDSLANAAVDFEDLTLAANSYHNGYPGMDIEGTYDGSFTSGGASFNNTYYIENFGTPESPFLFKFWGGWAYSNTTDVTHPGVDGSGNVVNESSAYNLPSGGGAGGSANYGVAFYDPFGFSPVPKITLPAGTQPRSMQINNTTYAALSMLNGDGFSNPFGPSDSFVLTVNGTDVNGTTVGTPVNFNLAVGRDVVDQWTTVDLSSLAGAANLLFSVHSTNDGTPTYFAMDNLELAPLRGDLNLDGSISVADISVLMNALSDLKTYETFHKLTDNALLNIADVNDDGFITNTDIQSLIAEVANAQGGQSTVSAVPEPSAILLALCGAMAGLALTRSFRTERGCRSRSDGAFQPSL